MSRAGRAIKATTRPSTSGPPKVTSEADLQALVPTGLRVAAALSWRFLVVVGALYILIWLIGYFTSVVIPLAIALLLAALMAPGVSKLVQWRVPKGLATLIVLIGGIAVLGGLLTFVISEFANGLPQVQKQVGDSLDTIKNWLLTGPLHLRQQQITDFIQSIIDTVKANQSEITTSALTTAAAVGEGLAGFLLTVFILIFFLYGGDQIWSFLVRGVPRLVRDRVDVAGRRGFASLVSYVRATAAVAVVDAVGIGVGLWILGVQLFVPLAALVFLGAFIPIIGAVVAGSVAVLVTLVTLGFAKALIVLAIVIGVMQLEGHVLQPWLLGRAVKLHPLAVVLAITGGLIVAGIAGALLAVPLLAVLNAGVRSFIHDGEVEPETVDVVDNASATPDPVATKDTSSGTSSGSGTSGGGEEQPEPSADW